MNIILTLAQAQAMRPLMNDPSVVLFITSAIEPTKIERFIVFFVHGVSACFQFSAPSEMPLVSVFQGVFPRSAKIESFTS